MAASCCRLVTSCVLLRALMHCRPGYKTVSTSNNVIGCSAAGSFTGSFMCLSQPPTFTNATYAVYENSPIGTAVGTVKATPANFEQQIDYAVRAPSMPVSSHRVHAAAGVSFTPGNSLLWPLLLCCRSSPNTRWRLTAPSPLAAAAA